MAYNRGNRQGQRWTGPGHQQGFCSTAMPENLSQSYDSPYEARPFHGPESSYETRPPPHARQHPYAYQNAPRGPNHPSGYPQSYPANPISYQNQSSGGYPVPSQSEEPCDQEDLDEGNDDFDVNSLNPDDPEDLLCVIDKLLFSKQKNLEESIEKYNAQIMCFNETRQFDEKSKKTYLHWRRQVAKYTGILKRDVTRMPPNQFRLEEFLIDPNTLEGDECKVPKEPNPSAERPKYNKSGLPDANLIPHIKPGNRHFTVKQMKNRLQANVNFDSEKLALQTLSRDNDLKMEMLRNDAKDWLVAKKAARNREATKVLKRLRRKIRKKGNELQQLQNQ